MRVVTRAEDEPWAVLTPHDVQRLLSDLSIRWWVAGGWALDVEGRHPHRDIDVAVLRPEHEALREELRHWDLRIAHKGTLQPWQSGPVGPPENTLWARPRPEDPWHIDFKIESVDGNEWVYRRDPTIRRPLDQIGRSCDGIPFLTADLARLYKSRVANHQLASPVASDTADPSYAADESVSGDCPSRARKSVPSRPKARSSIPPA